MDFQSVLPELIFVFLLFLLSLSLLSLAVLSFELYQSIRHKKRPNSYSSIIKCFLSRVVGKTLESKVTPLPHSLHFEITPLSDELLEGPVSEGSVIDSGSEECGKKKKKKKAKKKGPSLPNPKTEEHQPELKEKPEVICSYPFTSLSSAIQRKIKLQYDQLVKSNEANGLTLAQVGQFVNCLVESKNELQQRSESIQRRFTIAKALLHKADRSCFDRLHQQIYKIELEHKRLEEDAFVYNWLQQQLKLSPAYKKLLEVGACMESEASKKLKELEKKADTEFGDISFEELLEQEKKDSFWQKRRKSLRSS